MNHVQRPRRKPLLPLMLIPPLPGAGISVTKKPAATPTIATSVVHVTDGLAVKVVGGVFQHGEVGVFRQAPLDSLPQCEELHVHKMVAVLGGVGAKVTVRWLP